MSEMTWFYDENTGRYVVKGARILFANFQGAEQNYNQAGKRNFRLVLDESLAEELKGRGVYVRERPGREEGDEPQMLTKISVYKRDADIRFLSGKAMTSVTLDDDDPERDGGVLVDREFQKGHVVNGKIGLEFHISRNTRVMNSSPYARVDTIILPIQKSRLLDEYDMDDIDFDDPFGED